MHQFTNLKSCAVVISVGAYAWLSINHLQLLAYLLQKLGTKFVGPYPVVAAVGPVPFCLKFLHEWKIHIISYVS